MNLPPNGRSHPRQRRYNWDAARRRLEANPGEWVQIVDERVSRSTVPWCRDSGPLALAEIREETDYRLRATEPDGTGILWARWVPGEKVERRRLRSALDEQIVRTMRERFAAGEVTREGLSTEYGLARSTVGYLLRGTTWPDAGGPLVTDTQPIGESA